jgi:bacterial/archaeal transporter family-2 protein
VAGGAADRRGAGATARLRTSRVAEFPALSKLPFVLAAVVIGGILTFQPGLNADVARRLGNPFGAGALSIAVSFALSLAIVFATRQEVAWSAAQSMPWYLWFAGSVGVIFVVGTLWLAPILGAALLFASVVAGQMIVATLADLIGFGGYQSQSFDPWRLVGILLVLAGVAAFSRAG